MNKRDKQQIIPKIVRSSPNTFLSGKRATINSSGGEIGADDIVKIEEIIGKK